MEKPNVLTRALAVVGTILVWVPLLAPILTSAIALVARGTFRFDYLMPAELFPMAFAGGGLLLWAALRAHAHVKLVAWGLGIAALMLAGSQGLAVATGLASGKIEPQGWIWALVLASLAAYALAMLAVAIGGVLMLLDLFGRKDVQRRDHAGGPRHRT